MRRKWLRVTRYGLRVERLGSGFEGLPEYAKLVTGPHRSDPMPAARNKMRQLRMSVKKAERGL